MGLWGWLALAAAVPGAAVAATLAWWSLRLYRGMRRRGDVPPYGHPEPLPLPDYARRDLRDAKAFVVGRRRRPSPPES